MNTDTTDNNGANEAGSTLREGFGDKGTNVNAGMAYGHPHGEAIIEGAKEILGESETGRKLISVQTHHNIPIQIVKGVGASGFNPQSGVIYIQVTPKTKLATPEITLELVKALREADQELIGFTAPDPQKDLMEYATVMHSKTLDAIVYICTVVKELTNSSHYSVLLDTLEKLGHINVYKAYEANASEEELFDAYAGI